MTSNEKTKPGLAKTSGEALFLAFVASPRGQLQSGRTGASLIDS